MILAVYSRVHRTAAFYLSLKDSKAGGLGMVKMMIGRSGISAPRMILGTFGVGGGTAWQDTTTNDEELIAFIRDAHSIGVCGIDTAPVYGLGRGEEIVGKAIASDRENWFLATKCSLNWRDSQGVLEYERNGKKVYRCFSKESLIADAQDSMRRMKTDYLDLLIIHRCPQKEQFGPVMEAMQEMKERGMIKSVGLSNTAWTPGGPDMVRECCRYGELDLIQEEASLLQRERIESYKPVCEEFGITFQAHTALEKGALAGKIIPEAVTWKGDNRSGHKWFQKENIPKINELTKNLLLISEKYNCSVPALCMAWMKAQGGNMSLLVGARHLGSIQDSMKALEIDISAQDLAAMNALADKANGR